MTLFIGADHRGIELKNAIIEYFHEKNVRIEDLGPYELDPLDDAIDFSQKVSQAVLQNPAHLGIVICGSGCAVSMAANRIKGIRAGLAMNEDQAKHIRENDSCNIIALAADYTPLELSCKLIDAFITATPKTEEKYMRRIEKLDK